MKTHKIYTERLSKLAMHLENVTNHPEFGLINEVTIVDYAGNVRIPYQVKYQEFVFQEFPIVFEEWYFTEKYGIPMCEGANEEEGTIAAVIDFFDLNPDEFCFLFDIEGFQLIEQFGGGILTFESDGPAYARNMKALVQAREKRPS